MQILEAFCGGIAQSCLSRQKPPAFDINLVDSGLIDLARDVTKSHNEHEAFIFWLWQRALCVFAIPGAIFAVGEVAHLLVEKRFMDGDEVRALWDKDLQAANTE